MPRLNFEWVSKMKFFVIYYITPFNGGLHILFLQQWWKFSQTPESTRSDLKSNIYINAKNVGKPSFFDKFKLKIGRQCIHNYIGSIFASVNFNWNNNDLGSDQIRVGLKKSLFTYFIWQNDFLKLWHFYSFTHGDTELISHYV